MHRVLSAHVERNEMPGLVTLVSRHDDLYVETLGTLAVGDGAPMSRDTIFRIASITKPITAVAAMILVEECKLRLDESIEPWLPELANRRVMKSLSSLEDTVPAHRAITVRDLLSYRMGFGNGISESKSLGRNISLPPLAAFERKPSPSLRESKIKARSKARCNP
jgi:CubicO group peptidase (beta-lactamase class C family)